MLAMFDMNYWHSVISRLAGLGVREVLLEAVLHLLEDAEDLAARGRGGPGGRGLLAGARNQDSGTKVCLRQNELSIAKIYSREPNVQCTSGEKYVFVARVLLTSSRAWRSACMSSWFRSD